MILTKDEEAILNGRHGPGVERCLRLLIKYGEALGAERLVNVASAHVYNDFPLDLLTELTDGAERLGAFTTLHPFMSLSDPLASKQLGIPEEITSPRNSEHLGRVQLYRQLGFIETYTCVPYLVGNLAKKGDCVSWFGSGVQLAANSIIGARQNRDGAVINMAIALTGKAPLYGFYLDENRYAEVHVLVEGLDTARMTTTDYGAIGYYVGAIANEKNTVIDGLSKNMNLDDLKYLLTPLSTSGAVSLCHVVGVTPEAPDLKSALGNKEPVKTVHVGPEEVGQTVERFSNHETDTVDLVIFGCPHSSIRELRQMARLLRDKRVGNDQRLWIGTAHQIYDLAQTMGYAQTIENAGGIFTRACMATLPDCPLPNDVKLVATNSFKTAHYVTVLSKGRIKAVIGDIESCVRAATTGRWEGGSADET